MAERDKYTREITRLPKPIDEMTDDELWELFPPEPLQISWGKVIGHNALGPIVLVSDELFEFIDKIARGKDPKATA
jgi:hypothetical protein